MFIKNSDPLTRVLVEKWLPVNNKCLCIHLRAVSGSSRNADNQNE